jgi:hypothetical protein
MPWMQSVVRVAALAAAWTLTVGANSCTTNAADPRFVAELVLKNAAGEVRNEFARGEPIHFELTVRNRSDEEVVMQFPSARHYELVVFDAGSSQVRWTWSSDKAFAQYVTELTFAPAETKAFTGIWDHQIGDDGQAVGPGNYEARGVLLFQEFATNPLALHQLGSPLKAFRVN